MLRNIRITSITRHQKRFSTSNSKIEARTMARDREGQSGQHGTYLDETLELGAAVRRGVVAKRDDVLSFYEYHRVHIYSPETWETI